MSEKMQVLFANEAYYAAFLSGDFEKMETLWARSQTISCIHPGWHHLLGWKLVMESWASILSNSDLPTMEIKNATANIYGDFAIVICYEVFHEASLVATNVFARETDGWKIMHHQAGGAPLPLTEEESYEQNSTIQ